MDKLRDWGFFSKDGNKYDNPWDRDAADTRYNQNQEMITQLKRANDLQEQANLLKKEKSLSEKEDYEYIDPRDNSKNRKLAESMNVDLYGLLQLADRITEGDPKILQKMDNVDDYNHKISTTNILLNADKFINQILITYGIIIAIIISIIAYMNSKFNIVIGTLVILGLYITILKAYMNHKIAKNLSKLKTEEYTKLEKQLERSKEKAEKDFETFRLNNYNEIDEEKLMKMDIGFKPLDLSKVKKSNDKKYQYSDYINNIK